MATHTFNSLTDMLCIHRNESYVLSRPYINIKGYQSPIKGFKTDSGITQQANMNGPVNLDYLPNKPQSLIYHLKLPFIGFLSVTFLVVVEMRMHVCKHCTE